MHHVFLSDKRFPDASVTFRPDSLLVLLRVVCPEREVSESVKTR
jgi:hypothetical protein